MLSSQICASTMNGGFKALKARKRRKRRSRPTLHYALTADGSNSECEMSAVVAPTTRHKNNDKTRQYFQHDNRDLTTTANNVAATSADADGSAVASYTKKLEKESNYAAVAKKFKPLKSVSQPLSNRKQRQKCIKRLELCRRRLKELGKKREKNHPLRPPPHTTRGTQPLLLCTCACAARALVASTASSGVAGIACPYNKMNNKRNRIYKNASHSHKYLKPMALESMALHQAFQTANIERKSSTSTTNRMSTAYKSSSLPLTATNHLPTLLELLQHSLASDSCSSMAHSRTSLCQQELKSIVSIRETHHLAEAQQIKNAKLREAFNISEYFVEGSSFDSDRKAKEDLAKSRALQEELDAQKESAAAAAAAASAVEKQKDSGRRYGLVRTPSKDESGAGDGGGDDIDHSTKSDKKKKKKRTRTNSTSPERKKDKKKKAKKHKKENKLKKKKASRKRKISDDESDTDDSSSSDSEGGAVALKKQRKKESKSKKEKKKELKKSKRDRSASADKSLAKRNEGSTRNVVGNESGDAKNLDNRSTSTTRGRNPFRSRSREKVDKTLRKNRESSVDSRERGKGNGRERERKRSRHRSMSVDQRDKHTERSSKYSKERPSQQRRRSKSNKKVRSHSRRSDTRSRSRSNRSRSHSPQSSRHTRRRKERSHSRSRARSNSRSPQQNQRRKNRSSRSPSVNAKDRKRTRTPQGNGSQTPSKKNPFNPFKIAIDKSPPQFPKPSTTNPFRKETPSDSKDYISLKASTSSNRSRERSPAYKRSTESSYSGSKNRNSKDRSKIAAPSQCLSNSSEGVRSFDSNSKDQNIAKDYLSSKKNSSDVIKGKSRTPTRDKKSCAGTTTEHKSAKSRSSSSTSDDRKSKSDSSSPSRSRSASPARITKSKRSCSPESRNNSKLAKDNGKDANSWKTEIHGSKQEPSSNKKNERSPSSDSSELSYSPAKRNPERYRDILDQIEKEKREKYEKRLQEKKEKDNSVNDKEKEKEIEKEKEKENNGTNRDEYDINKQHKERAYKKDKETDNQRKDANKKDSNDSKDSNNKRSKPTPVVRLQSQSDDESDNEDHVGKVAVLDEFQKSDRDRDLKDFEMLKQLKTDIAAKAREKLKTIEQLAVNAATGKSSVSKDETIGDHSESYGRGMRNSLNEFLAANYVSTVTVPNINNATITSEMTPKSAIYPQTLESHMKNISIATPKSIGIETGKDTDKEKAKAKDIEKCNNTQTHLVVAALANGRTEESTATVSQAITTLEKRSIHLEKNRNLSPLNPKRPYLKSKNNVNAINNSNANINANTSDCVIGASNSYNNLNSHNLNASASASASASIFNRPNRINSTPLISSSLLNTQLINKNNNNLMIGRRDHHRNLILSAKSTNPANIATNNLPNNNLLLTNHYHHNHHHATTNAITDQLLMAASFVAVTGRHHGHNAHHSYASASASSLSYHQKQKIVIKPFKINDSQPLVAHLTDSTLVDTIVSKVSTATVAAAESAARRSSRSRSRSRPRRGHTHSRSKSSHYSSSSSRSRSRTRRSSRTRSRSRTSHSSTSGSSSSRSSSSGSSRSGSRSPSIPRRRGSPSFLDRRRITSARKRPIPYHRKTPSDASSYCSSCSSPRSLSRSPTRSSRSPSMAF